MMESAFGSTSCDTANPESGASEVKHHLKNPRNYVQYFAVSAVAKPLLAGLSWQTATATSHNRALCIIGLM